MDTMEMKDWYKHALTSVNILIPIVVLAWGNTFRSGRQTFARGVLAVVLTWSWIVATSLAVTEIDLALASSQADIDRVVNGDGGRHVGAVLFGWLPSVLLVLLCWAGIRGFRALRATNRSSRAS
jgi:hypothetical protein